MSTHVWRALICATTAMLLAAGVGCSDSSDSSGSFETRGSAATSSESGTVKVSVLDASGNVIEEGQPLLSSEGQVLVELSETIGKYDAISLRLGASEVWRWDEGTAPAKLLAERIDFSRYDATEEPARLEAVVLQDNRETHVGWELQVVDTRLVGLKRLNNATEGELIVHWDGKVPVSIVTNHATAGTTPIERVRNFLLDYPELFRFSHLEDLEEQFVPRRVVQLDESTFSVRFQQHVTGVPVYGSYLNAKLDADRLLSIQSGYVPQLDRAERLLHEIYEARKAGNFPSKAALDALKRRLVSQHGVREAYEVGETRLMIVDPRFLGDAAFDGTRVA